MQFLHLSLIPPNWMDAAHFSGRVDFDVVYVYRYEALVNRRLYVAWFYFVLPIACRICLTLAGKGERVI